MKNILSVILFVVMCGAASALVLAPPTVPLVPPDAPPANEILPYPARPSSGEYKVLTEDAGYFSWRRNAELDGFYMLNRNGRFGFFGLFGGMVNFRFQDPYYLGTKLGLAEDAVEFKAGIGPILGFDVTNRAYFSVTGQIETTVYLKEASFFDLDPFLGAGINMNILGTDWQVGGLGVKVYCGVLKEFGAPVNKLALTVGYGGYQINNARNIEGLFIQISKPVRL